VSGATVSYAPDRDYSGADSFTFVVNDGQDTSAPATIDIAVEPVNDRPFAEADNVTTNENTALAIPIADILANDRDADGDTLILTAVLPHYYTFGDAVIAGDKVIYTPQAGFSGGANFRYEISDGHGATSSANVYITVVHVSGPPSCPDTSFPGAKDEQILGAVTCTDAESDPLAYALVTGPSHGTLSFNVDVTFAYLPLSGYAGSDTFTYTANDGTADSRVATAALTITGANAAPTAANDSFTTSEDTPLVVPAPGLLGNDADADGDALSTSLIAMPAHGALTYGPDGSFSYVPSVNFHGSDSFSYAASDGHLLSPAATVSITVTPVNDAPRPVLDEVSTSEDTPVSGNVLANDLDPDGDTLTAALESGPAHGSATVQPNGGYTYTPSPDYRGPDEFTYRASDGQASEVALVKIAVAPAGEPPVAPDQSVTTPEDAPLPIDLTATDPDGGTPTIAVTNPPDHGTYAAGVYTPAPNFNGSDSFVYVATDTDGLTDTGTVAITVTPVNDAPDVVDRSVAVDEDGSVTIELTATDADGDAPAITATAPVHGAYAGGVYTPAPGYSGADSFTYTADDGNGGSDTATVSVTVRPLNDKPEVTDLSVETDEDTPLAIVLRGADGDGDTLTITTTAPGHGVYAGGLYTPAANYHGPDSFAYTADDGEGGTATATVSITVRPVNDPPVATDQSIALDEDTSVPITFSATDADGDTLSFAAASAPQHGSWDGTTYTPAPNYYGPDSFDFLASDGSGGVDAGTISITVRPLNDAPDVGDRAVETDEDTPLPLVLSGSDGDGDLLTVATTAPAHGSYAGGVYTPAANYHGPDAFTYTASDGKGGADTATISITVRPVNDPPRVVDRSVTTAQNTPVAIALAGSDVDGDVLSFSWSTPAHGGYDGANYTPAAGYSGPDLFTYTARDGSGGTATAMVSITVTPVNPPADTTPPSCEIVEQGKTAAGNPFVRFRVTEIGSGLARHEPGYLLNTSVLVAPYAIGSLGPVTVTATAINKRKGMAVEVFFYDLAGNRALCDPIVATLQRTTVAAADQVFRSVPHTDHRVTVRNGSPGMRTVVLLVNGRYFGQHRLRPGQVRAFTIATAMKPGYVNTIRVQARGPKGAKATIMIANIP
jgi:hypothetical protein